MNEQFEGEVLLCEDNRMNQDLVCARLSKLGLKTIVAENGKEGVDMVASRVQNSIKPFALIFMDIFMPVMDGIEATDEIVKLNTGAPVIAMTASSTPSDREKYMAHGMSDCLNKPFTPKELLACIEKYLKPLASAQVNQDTRNTQDTDLRAEEKLRIKLINNFVRNNKTIYNEITKAIDEGDIKLAHRLVHTLKGNAGILGKTRLQKAAQNAENLLINEKDRTDQFTMEAVKTELDAVIKEFEPLVDESWLNGEAVPSEPFDREKAQVLFEELEVLLDGGDLECLRLIDSLRRIPGSTGLIQQLEYFEFDAAMKTLAQIKKEWTEAAHE
jgi:CheY-like chemotaxis protein